jgi:hypothetical protein
MVEQASHVLRDEGTLSFREPLKMVLCRRRWIISPSVSSFATWLSLCALTRLQGRFFFICVDALAGALVDLFTGVPVHPTHETQCEEDAAG